MSEDGWDWQLSARAADAMDSLDSGTQQRLLDKFDDIVNDEFRDPDDFAKSLTNAGSWQSLRVGDYRAIVRFDRGARTMEVGTVGHRSTIYDEFR